MILKRTHPAVGSYRQVYPAAGFPRSHRFDKWATHGALGYWGLTSDFGPPEREFLTISWTLKDGTTWTYFSPNYYDPAGWYYQTIAILDGWLNWQVAGYPGNWAGEGYNHSGRAVMSTKVPYGYYP